jgi:putative oxidoreductase
MMRRVLALATLVLTLPGCVQPAYDRTVIYDLDVSALDDVKTVGIRGSDSPLSWERDSALVPVVKDSLYRVVITYRTGYLITQAKFTVNGEFELKDRDNRRITFATGDTTIYRARFNQPQ